MTNAAFGTGETNHFEFEFLGMESHSQWVITWILQDSTIVQLKAEMTGGQCSRGHQHPTTE